MVVVTLGGWRFWRQQNALVRGKIHAGGFEIYLTMFLVFSVSSACCFTRAFRL